MKGQRIYQIERMTKSFLVIMICASTLAACVGEEVIPGQPPPTRGGDVPTLTAPPASPTSADTVGPDFDSIAASSAVFAKSDCKPTSITVTATITDPSGVTQVVLWYRVGAAQSFTPIELESLGNDKYRATVRGLDVPGSEYGPWEFYIVAEDGAGNTSQSLLDTSVSLLPCVG
ncbi:MAG: hypothetical protein HYZ49_13560 [Chloroflexi bacterium]|nr:hypothetical protein [Chloroflexota bacterium]